MTTNHSAIEAYSKLREHYSGKDYDACLDVGIEDKKYKLPRLPFSVLDKGHSAIQADYLLLNGEGLQKRVYALDDDRAVALPKSPAYLKDDDVLQAAVQHWISNIQAEKEISQMLRDSGFEALEMSDAELIVGNDRLPVLVSPQFSKLAEQGLQVRDTRHSSSSCGHSMLFGTAKNVEDPERLKLVMDGLLDDAAQLIVQGISLRGDTCNLAIKDTKQTQPHIERFPNYSINVIKKSVSTSLTFRPTMAEMLIIKALRQ